MRVLYFHQHFSTPDGSTGTRSYHIAKQLMTAGHRVTMVCGSGALSKSGLTGPFFRGKREGVVDSLQIIEFELPYSNYDGYLRRSLTFLRFAIRSVVLALTQDYEAVFATSTPLTVALPGIAARWFRAKPFVFEVRDLWPELPRALGAIRNPLLLGIMDLLEFLAYRSATSCIALSPGIAQGIIRRGVPSNHVIIAPNGCNLELFAADTVVPLPQIPGLPDNAFVATFTGAHGVANGLDAAIDAAAELRKQGRSDIYLVFVGDGKEKPALMERARLGNLNNCLFVEPMPKKLLAQFLCRRANAGLMILSDVPAFYYGTSPNKFFDYLSSGLPVLVNYPGWMQEMIKQYRIGIPVPPNDPAAFAEALIYLADHRDTAAEMGLRGRELARREFLQTTIAQRCVTAIERAAGYAQRPQTSSEEYRLRTELGELIGSHLGGQGSPDLRKKHMQEPAD